MITLPEATTGQAMTAAPGAITAGRAVGALCMLGVPQPPIQGPMGNPDDTAERSGPRLETATSPCIKCVLARSELEKGLIN